MPKPARVLAAVAVIPIAGMVAACIADVSDDTDDVGSAAEPGVHHGQGTGHVEPPRPGDPAYDRAIPPGPCRTACEDMQLGKCGRWENGCLGFYPDDDVDEACENGVTLTCRAAEYASHGGLAAQMLCYRECESLN